MRLNKCLISVIIVVFNNGDVAWSQIYSCSDSANISERLLRLKVLVKYNLMLVVTLKERKCDGNFYQSVFDIYINRFEEDKSTSNILNLHIFLSSNLNRMNQFYL